MTTAVSMIFYPNKGFEEHAHQHQQHQGARNHNAYRKLFPDPVAEDHHVGILVQDGAQVGVGELHIRPLGHDHAVVEIHGATVAAVERQERLAVSRHIRIARTVYHHFLPVLQGFLPEMLDPLQIDGFQPFGTVDGDGQQRPFHLVQLEIHLCHPGRTTHLHGLAVEVGPSAVGQVVEGEFFGMAAFRIEEGGLVACLVLLRQLVEAVAHAVGGEIHLRDGGQRPQRDGQRQDGEDAHEGPLQPGRRHAGGPFAAQEYQHGQEEQDDVLVEGLGVGQVDGLAEAAAVADRVVEHQVEGQPRKHGGQDERHPRHDADADAAQHADAHQKLGRGQQDAQAHGGGHQEAQVHKGKVLLDDQTGSHRIEQLQDARQNEGQGETDSEESAEQSHSNASICWRMREKMSAAGSIFPFGSLQSIRMKCGSRAHCSR